MRGPAGKVPENLWPDPFAQSAFAGHTIQEVESTMLTLAEYQASGGLDGLGCACGCGGSCEGGRYA